MYDLLTPKTFFYLFGCLTHLSLCCCLYHHVYISISSPSLFMVYIFMQVMLAASFWSLLDPAIEISRNELRMGYLSVFPAAVGLIIGATFVGLVSRFLPTTVRVPLYFRFFVLN